MNHGPRTALCLSTLGAALALGAAPAAADPGAPPIPEGSTVVVVTPPAPVVVRAPAQVAPPGAEEAPPPAVLAGAPQTPASAAPQNEPWSNVSHINGALVPVGERGDYLYKWKTTNIASNPLGWMLGFYGLSVSRAVGPHAAIRGDANLFRPVDEPDGGYELGVTVPLYFKRVFQGPFIEPGVLVRDLDTTDAAGPFIGPQVNFGWQWTFDSGFNVAIAAGMARRLGQPSMSAMSADGGGGGSYEKVEPTGYFRVGYAY